MQVPNQHFRLPIGFLFILHEGRKVNIKDNTMREWKEIQLEDGNAGWVPASVIEII